VVAIPLLTVAAVVVYGLVVGLLGQSSDQAALDLIVAGFVVGAVSFTFLIALNVLGAHARAARWLARTGSYLVLAYVQANVLLVGFLLLAVLGLA
jgi:hypothetical protein